MYIFYILLIVIIDQATKYIAKLNLASIDGINLIPGYLSFTYLENRGAAFGIFKDKKIILVGLTSLVIIFMFYYLIRNKELNKYVKISFILIIGGAIGNLIDRVIYGYVVDYIHFYIKDVFNWPVFNFADICVVCGTILLAVNLVFQRE